MVNSEINALNCRDHLDNMSVDLMAMKTKIDHIDFNVHNLRRTLYGPEVKKVSEFAYLIFIQNRTLYDVKHLLTVTHFFVVDIFKICSMTDNLRTK